MTWIHKKCQLCWKKIKNPKKNTVFHTLDIVVSQYLEGEWRLGCPEYYQYQGVHSQKVIVEST